jgi:aldehyde dehydrogenase family 7 member A1
LAASIIMPDADLSLAVPAVFFGAVGTAGQRCTSTRRLYLHRTIAPDFLSCLQKLYASVRAGDPLEDSTLLGPLHTQAAISIYSDAIKHLQDTDAEILIGGKRYDDPPLKNGNFVQPTIAIPKILDPKNQIWSTETFAPILNAAVFDDIEQAIEWNNAVPQGLSSSLWTRDLRNVGKWIGPAGSDAGIVNVRSTRLFCSIVFTYHADRSTWARVALRLEPPLEVTRLDIDPFTINLAFTEN